MNQKKWTPVVLIGIVAILFSCGFSWKMKTRPREIKKPGTRISGIWQMKDAAKTVHKINFLPNGSFEMDLNGDGAKDIWGEYAASANRVTLIDKGGAIDPTCHSAGVYRYTLSRKELRFTPLSDRCLPRVKAFESAWKR